MRARCSTGSRSRRLTTAARATSISSSCATICRRRWRGRATRRSPKAAERRAACRRETVPAEPPAEPVRIDFEGIEYRILDLPGRRRRSVELQAGCTRAAVLPARQRWMPLRPPGRAAGPPRGAAAPLRPREAPDRTGARTMFATIGSRADAKKLLYSHARQLVHHGAVAEGRSVRGSPRDRRSRGPDRSASGVGADLRRGVAHQSRLLLRAQHARRRLAGA